jgi:hypothetical protein
MDLQLYARVLWRFRALLVLGLILAASLAFLSYVKVSFDGGVPELSYRDAEEWSSETTLFVTQQGFQYGRVAEPYLPSDEEAGLPPIPLADPDRLAMLTALYARLANSDEVRALIRRDGPLNGFLDFEPVPAPEYSGPSILPLLNIRATAATPRDSVVLVTRATRAFRTWLVRQQTAAGIFPEQRVVVEVLNRASSPQLVAGRGKTLPIVVFLTVMTAVIGLIFILENLRPRVRTIGDQRMFAGSRSA